MRTGLALASLALGLVGVVFSVSTWVAWAIVQPGSAGTLPQSGTVIIAVLLGALWVLVMAAAGLAIVFGAFAWRAGPAALWGVGLGVLSGVLSLAGAIVFAVTVVNWPVTAWAG
ncbi:hypothetical protein [Amycolatopsis sp.]|uniref:hypothetical protein n=1 Tax=Amycolatopsis sp. TaxID=37632 RepID=UPI002BD32D86|nr:hypothetical protein [Amycolatopsis sp.]HVV09392.1 hypothetical protein [Amycolatopsis sp.]